MLGEFADRWIDMRFDLAERTVELYQWLLNRHIKPTFGSVAVAMITTPEIRAWHCRIAGDRPTTAAKGRFGFQRGVIVASRSQLGLPA